MKYGWEAYEALDKLNSWVRSPNDCFSSPSRAIYDWKRVLIEDAIKSEQAKLSAIWLTLKCRDCGGSGRYSDSHGYEYPHCRRCSNSGTNKLTFLVSEIGRFVWHTPWDKSWYFDLPPGMYDAATESTDWKPNQPGKSLTVGEVAACLNVLEPIMPRPGWTTGYHGEEYDHADYRLCLGRTPRVCEFCRASGQVGDGVHHVVIRRFLEWSAWACNFCKARYATSSRWSDLARKYLPEGGNGKSIFDEFKAPTITDPDVLKWLARREGRPEVLAFDPPTGNEVSQ